MTVSAEVTGVCTQKALHQRRVERAVDSPHSSDGGRRVMAISERLL